MHKSFKNPFSILWHLTLLFALSVHVFPSIAQVDWDLDSIEDISGTDTSVQKEDYKKDVYSLSTPKNDGPKEDFEELEELSEEFSNLDDFSSLEAEAFQGGPQNWERQGVWEGLFEKRREEILERDEETLPFMAVLKKNAPLFEIDSKKAFRAPRKVFVKAKIKSHYSPLFIILDKKGRPKYFTQWEHLVPLDRELDIAERPKTYSPMEDNREKIAQDREINLENSLLGKASFIDNNAFNELFGTEDSSTTSEKVEYQLFYLWSFPIKFGAIFSFEAGRWEDLGNEENTYEWTSLNYGVGLKLSKFYKLWRFDFDFMGSAQKSFNFQGKKNEEELDLSLNIFQLDLAANLPTKYGDFILGGFYQRAYMSLKSSETNTYSLKEDNSDYWAWGLFLGHKFTVKL